MFVKPWSLPRGNPVVYLSMSRKEWHKILRGLKETKVNYLRKRSIAVWLLRSQAIAYLVSVGITPTAPSLRS
nr:hypothetical protein Iba_scaffold48974CG0010 [Ipomoea batatas]GME17476.1 hypothetical protein Iba_scaffold18897CG0010 [Ipomoea batatas]